MTGRGFRLRALGARLSALGSWQITTAAGHRDWPGAESRTSRAIVLLLLPLLAALTGASLVAQEAAQGSALAVHITSPLGRTGTPGAVRIVARIEIPKGATLGPVRFFVDGTAIGTDDDGPPYAVDWTDDNPFERLEIVVEASDSLGHTARDTVVLKPFELTDSSQVFGVLLEAAVRDSRGRFVTGLDPKSFTCSRGRRPPGSAARPAGSRPGDVRAARGQQPQHAAQLRLRPPGGRGRLVSYLRPADRVIVAPFSKQLEAVTGPTNDRATILEAIGAATANGGTAIFDSLAATADRIAKIDGRRVIILITDGYDENSRKTFADAVAAVKRADATVYAVGIGGVAGISLRGQQELRALATQTGGELFLPPRIQDLAPVYDRLAVDAQNRYVLSYTPTNQRQDGSWRQVTLTAGAPSDRYRVDTRDGYYAPKAPPVEPLIEFTVTDLQQQFADVTRDDLRVFEDGVEQKIEGFQIAVDPVQIVLALDESGSMKKAVDAVKDAAREFVQSLEPKDPLALVTFSDTVQFAHDLSTLRQWSYDAIDQYQALGGTALYDALYVSLGRLKAVQGRRAVVILTDGRDENNPGTAPGSVHTLGEVMTLLKEVDAVIYPIGLGPQVDRSVLEGLAEASGGTAYFPADVGALADQYRGIVENLRRRYVLQYTSTNPKRDGTWRTVKIESRTGSLQIKSRGGYYAPDR